jgi:hypothetical protein
MPDIPQKHDPTLKTGCRHAISARNIQLKHFNNNELE